MNSTAVLGATRRREVFWGSAASATGSVSTAGSAVTGSAAGDSAVTGSALTGRRRVREVRVTGALAASSPVWFEAVSTPGWSGVGPGPAGVAATTGAGSAAADGGCAAAAG
jgi:hypothetical protein